MGKTESGAIWLDKNLLSPYDYWQFWRNTDDRDVIRFLKIFTDLKISEIESLNNNNINELKILLANKTTEMLHGLKETEMALKISQSAFSSNSSGSDLPSIKLDNEFIEKKNNIIDLIIFSKLENSKSEIRRLIKNKRIRINNKIIETDKFIIDKKLFNEGFIKLSIGKKRNFKININ